MFVVTIQNVDRSSHTQEVDAIAQKQIYINSGESESDIAIVEKDVFEPPQE